MGFHLALVARINLIGAGRMSLTAPMLTGLLGPFVLKFIFSTIRPLHQAFSDAAYALRLFLFQMGQIAFSSEPEGLTMGDNTRWDRALRLVSERLILSRRSRLAESDEDSLNALSALAL